MTSVLDHACRFGRFPIPAGIDISGEEVDFPWADAPLQPELCTGEVQVWRSWLDQMAPFPDETGAWLSPEEHARAGRFHFVQDRKRFVARRLVLREILGRYLRRPPADLRFTVEANGKPLLAGPDASGIHFSVSHSDGLALFAFTLGGAVGIDLEHEVPIPETDLITAQFFPPEANVPGQPSASQKRTPGLLKRWTRTEACGKASGRGIADVTVAARTDPTQPPPAGTLGAPDEAYLGSGWLVLDLIPAPDYVASIAIRPRSPNLHEDCCVRSEYTNARAQPATFPNHL